MRGEGQAVDRFYLFRGRSNRFRRVAGVDLCECVVAGQAGCKVFGNRSAVDLGIGTFIPDDGQRVHRFFRAPPGISHHSHRGVVDLHYRLDAGHAFHFGIVKTGELAAEYRAVLDRRVQHARHLQVDGIDFFAVQLVTGIQTAQSLAGNLPVLDRLERNAFRIRRRELRRRCRDLAIADLALRSRMADHAVGDCQLTDGNIPSIGGGLHQHHACCGAATTHIIMRGADTAAARGRHITPGAFARQILAGGDLLGLDLFPVAFEFLGHQLSQTGQRALAHLGPGNANHAAVIRLDDDPDIDFGCGGAAFCRCISDTEGQAESQNQTAACGGAAHQKFTTRNFRQFAGNCFFHVHGFGS